MGSSNSAQNAATRREQQREQRINRTTSEVNAAYDAPSRQQGYSDFVGAIRDRYMKDLGDQQTVASRNQKFALARSGVSGGSADVDAKRTLGKEYQRGVLGAEDKAQGALANLKSSDEQSRLNLIQMAQSGLSTTDAAARAGAAIQANAQGAQSDALAKGLGDVFGETANTYKKQEEAAARRAGLRAPTTGSVYGNPWGRP